MALRPEHHLGRTINGCYRLARVLGAGGMGVVFEAEDRAGQKFAVKLLHAHLAKAEGAARFLLEAQVGHVLDSPHVVPVVDAGEEPDGTRFLVMPFLTGEDLAQVLRHASPLEPAVAVGLALQACEGLGAAHRAGVIHRDVKPSNLFLQHHEDGRLTLRVCDFGVAKRTEMYDDAHLTRTGASLGSPLYMSPEQLLSAKHSDERTDVYGLGATLYELLCGTTPHGDTTSLAELVTAISTTDPRSLQERAPWVGAELTLAVHRALCRDPGQRYQRMDELGQALRQAGFGDLTLDSALLAPVSEELRHEVAPRADLSVLVPVEERMSVPPSTVRSPADPLLGHNLGGKYRIIRLLGRGGMGSVYEAQAPDGARVAAKVIAPELAGHGSEARERLLREARAAVSLDSPHVVRTLDAGTDPEQQVPYIVMEVLRGVDFAALLERQGPMEPDVVVRTILHAGRGIGAAHRRGIVHRDIKPANLFLSVQPGDPSVTVKVCDFGVAKRIDVEGLGEETAPVDLTRTGGMLGSPAYMSPEQAQDAKSVDARTDVWSLGVALYEGLSGRQPWDTCATLGQLIVAICTRPVPWIQDYAPWVEPGLADVVHRALQRAPADRWPTVEAFCEALTAFAGGREQILRDEYRGLSASRRARVELRSSLPPPSRAALTQASTVGSAAVGATVSPPRRRTWATVGIGVAVALGAAASLYVAQRPRGTAQRPFAGAPSAPSAEASPGDAAPSALLAPAPAPSASAAAPAVSSSTPRPRVPARARAAPVRKAPASPPAAELTSPAPTPKPGGLTPVETW